MNSDGPGSAQESLGVSGGRGALLGVVGQFGKLAVNFLSLVVLARLIGAEDYGLIAMVMAIVGVAELIRDMGLSTAAVRAKTLSSQQRSNLWWVNSGIGAACSIAVCALAPAIAWFYGEPRLVALTIAMSTLFLFGGMSTQYNADLIRRMQFGRQALANVAGAAVAFIAALIAALAGWGYWALAVQQVLGAVLGFVLLAVIAGWLPERYRRGVPMAEFFRFGMPLFGSQVLTYFSGNIDMILVGRFFGSAPLGHYSRGIQIVRMPINQIRGPLGNAALSTLTKVRDDKSRYSRYVAKAQLGMLYPIAVVSTLVAATAPDVVPFLLGEDWLPVAAFVTIFAVGDMVSSLAAAGGWLYLSEGKSSALLRYTITSATLRIALFGTAVPFGIHAVAGVYVLAPIFLWPFSLWYCHRATGHPTMPLFISSLRVFISTGAAFAAAYGAGLLIGEMGVIRFTARVSVYVLVISLFALVPAFRADARTVLGMMRALFRR